MNKKTITAIGRPTEVLSEENIKSVYHINAKVISCDFDDTELKQIIPINTVAQ